MRIASTSFSMAICLLIAQAAAAQDCCEAPEGCQRSVCGTPNRCGACGCKASCGKICRVVCEMKEVKKTCWVVECEEFCAPLPGCRHGFNSCSGCCDNCCVAPARCGKVRTRRKLVKKEIKCKVPVYKCVVEHLCDDCCDENASSAPVQVEHKAASAPLPPSLHDI